MATASFYTSETQNSTLVVQENNKDKNRIALLTKLETAWKADKVLSQKWATSFINELFKAIVTEFIELNAQNFVVETTTDESVLIKSDVNEKRLYVELFLTGETPLNYDIVINVYKNQKHLFGTAGSIKNAFIKLQNFSFCK